MKFYLLCGSPRKGHNTDQLLDAAIEGIKERIPDVEIEKIYIYDYQYTGCISCYGCKRKGSKSYGTCVKQDEIKLLLSRIAKADGLIVGSPIYFHDIPGQLHAFLERLLYPYLVYEKNYVSIAPKKLVTAFIYTMNATEKKAENMEYRKKLSAMEEYMGIVFLNPEIMYCYDTVQFDDYSKYMSVRFSEEEKLLRRQEFFPKDCEEARMLGRRLAQKVICQNPIALEIPDRI